MHAKEISVRELLTTLVATDTTYPGGSCTAASAKVAAAMTAAGFPASDLHTYAAPEHANEGGLVAVLPGRTRGPAALLLVAHIDTVSANGAEWRTPPFTLTEAGGYFRGRGVADNKAMAAILAEVFVRLRHEGFRPRRDVRFALTCGEETATAFNGAHYLASERRDLAGADLVLVPSGGATVDPTGRTSVALSAGEKIQQNFRLVATGTATHASRPVADNAIYTLARALVRVADLRFPVVLNPTTRRQLENIAAEAEPPRASAIRALLNDPADAAAGAAVTADPLWNAMLRTTCTATVVETGAQLNTVAATAAANINCRLLPGDAVDDIHERLVSAIGDSRVAVLAVPPLAEPVAAHAIPPGLIAAIEGAGRLVWRDVTVLPTMLTGATDARHFNATGTPAYGVTLLRYDPDGNGVHAADERIAVDAISDTRTILYGLIKTLGSARADPR